LLHWINTTGRTVWSTGSAELLLDEEMPTGKVPVAVRCQFGSQSDEMAMLDTGARWSLLGPDTIALLGEELGEALGSVTMSTRLGRFHGSLHRLPIRLIADMGSDLVVEGTCLALPEWSGPNILGFSGFLDRLRFALEPASVDSPARIHFGCG
jgi:hypothetical protein